LKKIFLSFRSETRLKYIPIVDYNIKRGGIYAALVFHWCRGARTCCQGEEKLQDDDSSSKKVYHQTN